jgi:hypothetical protein
MQLKEGCAVSRRRPNKIEDTKISFSVTLDFGGQETNIDCRGAVSDDQIKLTFDMMGQSVEILRLSRFLKYSGRR